MTPYSFILCIILFVVLLYAITLFVFHTSACTVADNVMLMFHFHKLIDFSSGEKYFILSFTERSTNRSKTDTV